MADKFISANAIYDELSDIFIEYLATTSNTDTRNALDSLYHTVFSAVETAPTVSPDEVRGVGEWIAHGDCGVTECSVCGWNVEEYVEYNYCPNCGAKMEVEGNA